MRVCELHELACGELLRGDPSWGVAIRTIHGDSSPGELLVRLAALLFGLRLHRSCICTLAALASLQDVASPSRKGAHDCRSALGRTKLGRFGIVQTSQVTAFLTSRRGGARKARGNGRVCRASSVLVEGCLAGHSSWPWVTLARAWETKTPTRVVRCRIDGVRQPSPLDREVWAPWANNVERRSLQASTEPDLLNTPTQTSAGDGEPKRAAIEHLANVYDVWGPHEMFHSSALQSRRLMRSIT